MHHADRIISRIIFLEGHPNLQRLDPLRIGQTARESLEADLAGELEAVALYREAYGYCNSVGDYVSKKLFQDLLMDERVIRTSSRPSSGFSTASGPSATSC
jgi:bacterioferritin